jgi:FkbH-like protein
MQLHWLPVREDFDAALREVKSLPAAEASRRLRELATSRLDLAQTTKLDRAFLAAQKLHGQLPGLDPLRLAILSSATTSHLPTGIRVAGLRRSLAIEIYEAPYGMYFQELMSSEPTGLRAFAPQAVLLALDARHLAASAGATADTALELLQSCWRRANDTFHCQIIQQTVMPVLPNLLGSNEDRMPSSPAAIVQEINRRLPALAAAESVDLLAVDRIIAGEGLTLWHDPALWHRSKHEVHPRAAALYGEHLVRLLAAARGRSAKCLVLDLDNTLWSGVIGDDGLEGIILGQGSEVGEAHAELQRYALSLTERGIILAVCSKNDEANALAPFTSHPEMILRGEHIACFVANWQDKATNLRSIAKQLNIGIDALVFVDDNPAERAIIRQELPEVHVPELSDDPSTFVPTLAAAGYFEALRLTGDDRSRASQYQANAERERLKESATDMDAYLRSLRMTLTAGPFDTLNLARITQLINKTNQFNLMTERLTEAEVSARMNDPRWLTLYARLTDRFGDNGLIAVLMAHIDDTQRTATIETFLMSCRVLGRGVEQACLNLLAAAAQQREAQRLIGQFRPTEKNAMVRELYTTLGFIELPDHNGTTRYALDLATFTPHAVHMEINNLREATGDQPAVPKQAALV